MNTIKKERFKEDIMKKCIMVGYEEEKLLALRMYAEQKGVSLEEELVQTVDGLYQRIVPGNVRTFLDMKVERQKPKKPVKSSTAVLDESDV